MKLIQLNTYCLHIHCLPANPGSGMGHRRGSELYMPARGRGHRWVIPLGMVGGCSTERCLPCGRPEDLPIHLSTEDKSFYPKRRDPFR